MGPGGEILIVEDDEDIRAHLTFILERKGYRVTGATNGEEALRHLRDGAGRTCVILLDLMMPVMNGWEFRDAQRSDPLLADIPVVVLTGRGLNRDEEDSLGASDYLLKPFVLDHLLALIGRYCCTPRPS